MNICKTSPALGHFDTVEEGVESVASGRAHNLLAVDIITDMGIAVVEFHGDGADGVWRFLGIGIVRIVDGVDFTVAFSSQSMLAMERHLVQLFRATTYS